jgi:UDP-2-acetamido-2-deoxy-ribo-hexuluronate aminotransferase
MDTLQCAVVLAKLERFDWEVAQRRTIGERYQQLLVDAKGVRRIAVRDDRDCVWAQFTVFVENREAAQKALQAAGVPTAVHYPMSLNRQPAYRDDASAAETVNSHWAGERVMSLPMSADLTPQQMQRIVTAVAAL